MPWFKVDDTLHSHPKARRAGMSAMGLWALGGSYASQYVTEGFVPEWFVASWPSGRKLAAELVRAELWRVGEREGEAGWWFHDWSHYQPTKEEIERERETTRERQRRWRERSRQARRNAVTNGVTNGVGDGVTNGAPSRPVPSRPTEVLTTEGGERTETLPAPNATFPTHCLDHQHVRDPGPCGGCKVARETVQRLEQDRRERDAADVVSRCPSCDPDGWALDQTGEATTRRCRHRAVIA